MGVALTTHELRHVLRGGTVLKTKEVRRLAGVPKSTLNDWIQEGVINIEHRGPGGRHRFTMMETLGIMVARRVHKSYRGCTPRFVGDVFRAFQRMPPATLEKFFREGATAFSDVIRLGASGRPWVVLKPAVADRDVCVMELYRRVRSAYQEVAENRRYRLVPV